MYVLDLETSVKVEQANKSRADLLYENDCTFMCALMTAKVSENDLQLKEYYGRENAEKACLSLPDGEYYTWNGSKFDTHFIYHLLRKNGFRKQPQNVNKQSSKKSLKRGEFDFLLAHGKILKLSFRNSNGIVEIKDACLLFTCSLANFIKNTCPERPKLVGTYDYNKYREFESDFSESDKLYCRGDVLGFAIGLHRIVNEFEIEFGMNILDSLTAGSFAMKYAKTKLDDSMFPNLDFPRGFVIGGKTFVNPIHEGNIMHDLLKIDANSFYPSIMAMTKLPYGNYSKIIMNSKQLNRYLINNPKEYLFAYLKEGFVEYNDMFSPIAIKHRTGTRIYPTTATHFDEVYLDDNILRDNKFLHEGLFEVYIFDSKVGIFDYMRSLFDLKNKYKLDEKFALELAVKIILNASYGKFLQRSEIKEEDFFEGIIKETGNIKDITAWYLYAPIGASITAKSRHILTSFMNDLQERFIYSDTDSLIFYGDCPNTVPLGLNLGQWKIENDMIIDLTKEERINYNVWNEKDFIREDGIFFARKTYAMTYKKRNKVSLTFCGISKRAIDEYFKDTPTLEYVRECMLKGINFNVLQSNKTLNGIVLINRAKLKKYTESFVNMEEC